MSDISRIRRCGLKYRMVLWLLLCTFLADAAVASRLYELEIPRVQVSKALDILAEKTQHSLFFRASELADIEVSLSKGSYTLSDALTQLFNGTNLNAVVTKKGVIVVSMMTESHKHKKEESLEMNKSRKGLLVALMGLFGASGNLATANDGQGASSDNSGFTLEEITVTARKVEENVQDIPISISAFGANELKQRQIRSSDQLSDVTPNLVFDAVSPSSASNSSASIFIRGIGQVDFIPTTDPGVGLYIDGVYMARSLGNTLDLTDIERIEVLRGPQGTLFGRNTIGGAVSVHTVRPNNEFGGSVEVEVGNDSKAFFTGQLNVPIADNFFGRIGVSRRVRDGYVERVQLAARQVDGVPLETDGVDLGDDDSLGVRASFVWEASDNLDFYLAADYVDEDENGAPQVSGGLNDQSIFPFLANIGENTSCTVAGPGRDTQGSFLCINDSYARDPYENEGNALVTSQLEAWGVSLEANWDINDKVSFKSITAYRDLDSFAARDADGTPYRIFHIEDTVTQNQFSQEFQLTGETDQMKWVLGLFYFEEEAHNPAPALFGPFGLLSGGFAENDNWAAFGQMTYDVTEKLSITGGIRYTEETKAFLPFQVALEDGLAMAPIFPNSSGAVRFRECPTGAEPGCNGVAGTFFAEGDFFLDPVWSSRDFEDTTILVSLSYDINDDTLVYGSYTQGYKAGGFDLRYVGWVPEPSNYGPEEADSFELGLKTTTLDNTLRFNLAAFFTDYDAIHARVRAGVFGAPITFNAGEAEIKGFELEALWTPTPSWMLQLGIGYLDAEYTRVDPLALIDGQLTIDKELARTPEISANFGIAYNTEINGWTVSPRIDLVYTDEHFKDTANDPRGFTESVETVNASISAVSADETIEVMLSGRNLSDEVYLISANSSYGSGSGYTDQTYARPREWSLSVKYNF